MTAPLPSALARLANADGHFVMLAIDQRESLRTMLETATGAPVSDDRLTDFKLRASQALTPSATAVLLDRDYGLPAAKAASCALILAADVLQQERGGPVTDATLDEGVTHALVEEVGAAALKLLVPWMPEAREAAVDLAGRFMDLCHAVGVPGIVEGLVRPADIASWTDEARDQALIEAAADLASIDPDLYKGEVPSYGRGDHAVIAAVSEQITQVLQCPWLVLSSGVSAADFMGAVTACVSGGASGFLAGRAVWADAVTSADPDEFLAQESTERLAVLARAVAEGWKQR